jgi:hypothetical protein
VGVLALEQSVFVLQLFCFALHLSL